MDPPRHEEIDASLGDDLNGPDSTVTVPDATSKPTDAPPVVDLIDSIALEAITMPPELHQSGSENYLDETNLIDPGLETRIGPYEVSGWIGSGP